MAKLNSEFNYKYQVIGETPWEKIKTLLGFLDGRKRAAALEQVNELKLKARYLEIEHLKSIKALPHVVLNLEAELIEVESAKEETKRNFDHNREEIKIIEKLLAELYTIVEPTRLKHSDGTPFTDEEMFEVNAANEFTVLLAREMQAEIIANGRPSAAKIKNAMSNPITWAALKQIGIISPEIQLLAANIDPTCVQLTGTNDVKLAIEYKESENTAKITRKEVNFS